MAFTEHHNQFFTFFRLELLGIRPREQRASLLESNRFGTAEEKLADVQLVFLGQCFQSVAAFLPEHHARSIVAGFFFDATHFGKQAGWTARYEAIRQELNDWILLIVSRFVDDAIDVIVGKPPQVGTAADLADMVAITGELRLVATRVANPA